MVPIVENYDSDDRESIDSYLNRWPKELGRFPKSVIEQWVYRHNPQFIQDWSSYGLSKWRFSLRLMSTSNVMRIEHLDGELEHWDYVGDTYIRTEDKYQWLSIKMREIGTFPEPIIVAENAQGILHPKSRPNEFMKTPYQLLEGHRRLGFLRAMYRLKWSSLDKQHKIWFVEVHA